MGLIHGLGSGIFFVSISIVLMMYFDRYRGIVNGIKNLGGTAASVVFPNLLLLVRDAYGFRACLLLYGALAMHLTPLGMLTKEPPRSRVLTTSPLHDVGARRDDANCGHQETTTNENDSPKSNGKRSISSCGFCVEVKELFATPVFYVIVVSGVVGYYTQSVFFATIVDFARDKGFSLAESASVMVYFGLTETMGRLCLPFASDRGLVRRSTLTALSFAAMAASIVLLERSKSLIALKVGATVFAAFFGAAVTVEGVVIADYLGVDSLSFVFGFTGAVSVPLFFGNPFVLGLFRDHGGSYNHLYLTLAASHSLVGLMWLAVVWSDRRNDSHIRGFSIGKLSIAKEDFPLEESGVRKGKSGDTNKLDISVTS